MDKVIIHDMTVHDWEIWKQYFLYSGGIVVETEADLEYIGNNSLVEYIKIAFINVVPTKELCDYVKLRYPNTMLNVYGLMDVTGNDLELHLYGVL